MARRVDKVELVRFTIVCCVIHAHGLAFDRDAALALDVHRIEQLFLHIACRHGSRLFENPVGEGRFAVIDMGDDRKVPDTVRIVIVCM